MSSFVFPPIRQHSHLGEEEKNLCEWITITAPQTIHEPPAAKTSHWPWLECLLTLKAREKLEGFQGCQWSRVFEQEDHLWIWTSWQNKTYYERQYGSAEAEDAYAKLRALSASAPTISLVLFERPNSYGLPYGPSHERFDEAWPSVTTLSYQRRLSPEERNKVLGFNGLDPISMGAPFVAPSTGGFSLSQTAGSVWPWSDIGGDVYIMLDYWTTPKDERKAVSEELTASDGNEFSVFQYLEHQARLIDDVDVVVRHAKFNTITDMLLEDPETEAKGQSIKYEYEDGFYSAD